ncbi:MAG: aldolase/citrate lyase family protein [Candidatus Omnitrophota bacterium]|nr:aldolase/citrate lyase family protein [Candidatus Omnitrophota bacterium]
MLLGKGKGLPCSWRIKRGQKSVGSWLAIPNTTVAEIMSSVGYDWLVIDMEHSSIGVPEAEELIRIVSLHELPVLVRVGTNDPHLIKRVLDEGASGIIVPMVNSRLDAKRAVAAAHFPPVGIRSVGLARAQGYGIKFYEYQAWAKKNTAVIIQIEHIDAVGNIADILNVKGISGVIVGPYDLSASMGQAGQFRHPAVIKALKVISSAMKKTNIPFGFHVVHPDVGIALDKFKEGYSFVAFGVDFIYLSQSSRSYLDALRKKGRC